MNNHSPQVLVVGAGPVGLGLAIDLAQRGVAVTIVERHDTIQRIPKGQNLTQRSGEHLRAWGVSRAIREATLIPPEFGNEGLVAFGSLFSGYHYDWFKRASVREFYGADNERLPQYETERVLRERARDLDLIEFLTGWSFANAEQSDQTVVGHFVETNGDRKIAIEAHYLVGCDGANSAVRDRCGINLSLDSRNRRMALLVLRSSELHRMLESAFPGKTVFNALDASLEGYWQFLGRTDTVESFFFHAPVPDDASEKKFDFATLLYRAIGREFAVEFDYIGFWDLRFGHADTYRIGRVFIAGDAAHSHPPYGGFGVNIGFEDARNLGWKLCARLQGWGTEALLDSYTEERHRVFASTRDDFIAKMIANDAAFTAQYDPEKDLEAFEAAWAKRATTGQDAVSRFVPNYQGSSLVIDSGDRTPGAVGEHRHQPVAGQHLSPLAFGKDVNCYEHLEAGYERLEFSLLARNIDSELLSSYSDAAAAANIALRQHRFEDAKADAQAQLVLVRPDHFIAHAEPNEYSVKLSPSDVLAKISGGS